MFDELHLDAEHDDGFREFLMDDLDNFDKDNFEALAKQNGALTWPEADLAVALGYQDKKAFRKVINRAMQACISLGMTPGVDFILSGEDYKLTRFACYLVAMNGDPKKQQVAATQVYLASLADSVRTHLEQSDGIDRIVNRDEISGGMKALASTAKGHGVENYALFMSEGYRGMYNMTLSRLNTVKGIGSKETLLDRMGRTELAANLFRVTQTDDKIKNEGVHGQRALEITAHSVGQSVREAMIRISGTAPETLPIAPHIKDVKKSLKSTGKKLKELDGTKATVKALPPKRTSKKAKPT